MKNVLLLFIAISITVSCGKEIKNNSLDDLNIKKLTIVSKIDSLNKELKILDQEILKLDESVKLHLVTVLPVKKDIFKHFIEIQGVVQADKNIEIKPELGGVIRSIYVKEGQKVYAGQTLAQLDDSSIRNSIAELDTQLTLAKTTFERQERLWKQKIGSEMQYLQAKAQKESLENNLATIRTQARKMKIIAPFSGIVDEIFPKNGELTSPQTPVVRLINLDKVYVEADVTETYLTVVKNGTEASLYFPSIDKRIDSKITQISNYINPDNRSFKVKINVPNKDKLIKPNLLADLRILDFKSEGLIIPSTLVQQDQKGNDYVYTLETKNNEKVVVKKLISVENEYKNEIFVSDGLVANDTLINAGARLVKDGDVVKIVENIN
ncbi:MAG: efflux RND transporter periplasmic adaptor subunit [Flavobacteriaceae bacterium]|nr:efflux RND transporter periplasmic adaptor subunit [Flavobacteriaceae bacterium]